MATALRAAKPKLTLSVPTATNPAHVAASAPRSPFPRSALSPSALSPSPLTSPTARNTRLNQRNGMLWATHGLPSPLPRSPLRPITLSAQSHTAASLGIRGGLRQARGNAKALRGERNIAFREEPNVKCVSPMPEDYYGEYRRLSRDERRWGSPS